jgi:hypothetical protein
LHGSLKVSDGQTLPPLAADVVTRRLLETVPTPHDMEHVPTIQAETTQSTGHALKHAFDSMRSVGQAAPPLLALRASVKKRQWKVAASA